MDLSFALPVPAAEASLSAADMASLMAALSERQATSTTAHVQAGLTTLGAATPLAPAGGAFNAGMAARLWSWKQE